MRDSLDRYYTPDLLVAACISAVSDAKLWPSSDGTPKGVVCFEPSAGGGAYARGAEQDGVQKVFTSDIDPSAPAHQICTPVIQPLGVLDFLEIQSKGNGQISCILGNPPYAGAERHVKAAVKFLSDEQSGGEGVGRLAFFSD